MEIVFSEIVVELACAFLVWRVVLGRGLESSVCVVSRLGGLWCGYIIRVVKVALRRSQVCVRFVNSIEMFTESL